jgi:molybdopterin converting factor small subunit
MADAANITILVPSALRAFCGCGAELPLAAQDVRSLLAELERRHPAFYRSVCDETGTVRRHVNVFVNTSHMRDREGLDTPLASGDVVTFLPAVSGG